MFRAFDVLFQVPITAEWAAKNNIDEPFRYVCLCCGAEVYVAAANSTMKTVHFRHCRGNSDRDCELYLGRTGMIGALNAAKKRTHISDAIYYDIKQKMFYAGISFPAEKLKEYESKSCILEFRSAYNIQPYDSIQVNRQNFAPDSIVQFPLKLTTNDCFIAILGANYHMHYEILNSNDFPTFFKIPLRENMVNKAKRIVGRKIYTNTSYYIIAKNKEIIQKIANYRENIAMSQIDEINALGSIIFGTTLEILSINADLIDLFAYFNYDLRMAENVIQLWPPMYSIDGVCCINEKKAYLLSTFELVPHSNISCENDKLTQFNGVFELDVTYPVRIQRDNVDIQIEQREKHSLQITEYCEQVTATKVKVTETNSFYLLNSEGYKELPIGLHFMERFSKIVKYRSNYPVTIFMCPESIPKSRVAILRDVLTYYKVEIPFDEQLIADISLSVVAQTYIEECRINNVINSKVLEFIKVGIV